MVIRSLKGFGAFTAASSAGRRFSSGPLNMTVVCGSEIPATPTIFVGVSISKRNAPLAVTRTRMRRLLREAARRVLQRHEASVLESRMTTILLVWRHTPPVVPRLKVHDVEEVVESALRRAISSVLGGER